MYSLSFSIKNLILLYPQAKSQCVAAFLIKEIINFWGEEGGRDFLLVFVAKEWRCVARERCYKDQMEPEDCS